MMPVHSLTKKHSVLQDERLLRLKNLKLAAVLASTEGAHALRLSLLCYRLGLDLRARRPLMLIVVLLTRWL